MFRKPNRTNPYTFGEKDWTDENWVEGVNDYFLSKTKAERVAWELICLLYTSPSPRDVEESRMPSSA